MKALGVIPARMASSRFPGKPLAVIAGKTMIERVYERAVQCSGLHDVLVATDHNNIFRHCREKNIPVVMTADTHVSGFDRICEVNHKVNGFTHIVNIQGDEPLLDQKVISQALSLFSHGECDIATAAIPIQNENDFHNENIVKVVTDISGKAMYFSRSAIPFFRNGQIGELISPLKHLGLYAYTTEALLKMENLPMGPHEQVESLEQLRFLYHGFQIFVTQAETDSIGVDIPEDITKVERLLSPEG